MSVTLEPKGCLAATCGRGGALAPRCEAGQLRLAASFYGEAGGQFAQTLTFTNVSRHLCRIDGWPRIAAVNGTQTTGSARTRRVIQSTRPPFEPLLLAHGAPASFDLYGADWNAVADRSCPRTSAISVVPPNGAGAVRVALKIPGCSFGFEIAPLVAGRTDREAWSVVWPPHRG